jgi:hypothetical protein
MSFKEPAMSNEEPPFTPGSHEDVNDFRMRTHGKLIPNGVFLSHLARRQAAMPAGASDSPIIEEFLSALVAKGLESADVLAVSREQARKADGYDVMFDLDLDLEDLALEQAVLDDLRAGKATLGAQVNADMARRAALLRLARDLAPEDITQHAETSESSVALAADEERAMREGQEAGTRRALHEISRSASTLRRNSPPARKVAEDQPPYQADPGESDGDPSQD